jgi:glycosyltransferase involved in cell wall biosynthesis
MDLVGHKIGGIETFIRNFIEYTPDDFEIEFVGVTCDKKNRPVGKWQKITTYRKNVNFLPILYVRDENVRTKIPLSLKFTLSLLKYKKLFERNSRILTYHRIEPSLALANTPGKKILFIHNDTMGCIYSPHSETKWRRFPRLYFQMERKLINQMNKVFVVREDVVEFYRRKYPFMADRFSFLPTWVDGETFHPYDDKTKVRLKSAFLEKMTLSANSNLILFVGRLEGQKDPLLLIDAFNYINKHHPQTRLLIVGTGVLKREVEAKIEQCRLKEKAVLVGALPPDEVAELMRISDLALSTSAFEGMQMSVLEALACGLPVVSTDVGEVRRVVKNKFSGLICMERNAAAIGDAVLKVLKGKNFSVENCLLSIKDYTAKHVLNNVYNAYYDLNNK